MPWLAGIVIDAIWPEVPLLLDAVCAASAGEAEDVPPAADALAGASLIVSDLGSLTVEAIARLR